MHPSTEAELFVLIKYFGVWCHFFFGRSHPFLTRGSAIYDVMMIMMMMMNLIPMSFSNSVLLSCHGDFFAPACWFLDRKSSKQTSRQ